MSLVTRGLGGNSMLVTAGIGFKDLITVILEENNEGGAQFHKQKRDLSFLKYSFNLPQKSLFNLVDEVDGELPDHEMSERVTDFLSDKVIDVDGHDYTIGVLPDDVEKLVNTAEDLDDKIQQVMQEADVLRKEAKRMLIDRAKKEIKSAITHQQSIFNDDWDLIEILLLADEL